MKNLERLKKGGYTDTEIGNMYGVSYRTIQNYRFTLGISSYNGVLKLKTKEKESFVKKIVNIFRR